MLGIYPKDFALHQIGKFDDETGLIIGTETELVATAQSVQNKEEATNG